jgi:signal transduction histidine kinase
MDRPQQDVPRVFADNGLPPGTHGCLIYVDDDIRRTVVGKFLAAGLDNGEKVACFADTTTPARVTMWLTEAGVEVSDPVEAGAFSVVSADETYCPHGTFVPEEMIERLRTSASVAVDEGFTGFRATGEMSWALKGAPGSDRLIEYETLLAPIFATHPITGLCQYDARRFTGPTLYDILRVHPFVVINGHLMRNSLYESSHQFLLDAQHRLEGTVDQLRGALEAKDRFVAAVSHELRTPLSGVFGFASEMRDRAAAFTPAEVAEFAGLIAQASATANGLVEDLLVAARLGCGDVALASRIIDLHELALSAILDPEIASQREGGSVRVEGLSTVALADPARVHQIVRNLLNNAARYGGNRVAITCGTEASARRAFLRVADDGPGVRESLQEVLFQPYQHGAQESGRTDSVGLGLYISRGLARLMGGDLTYRRQDGTTIFELTLRVPDGATSRPA